MSRKFKILGVWSDEYIYAPVSWEGLKTKWDIALHDPVYLLIWVLLFIAVILLIFG